MGSAASQGEVPGGSFNIRSYGDVPSRRMANSTERSIEISHETSILGGTQGNRHHRLVPQEVNVSDRVSSDEVYGRRINPNVAIADNQEVPDRRITSNDAILGNQSETTDYTQTATDLLNTDISLCDACYRENEHIQATDYCKECKDYLCELCSKAHRKIKATLAHELVEISKVQIIYTRNNGPERLPMIPFSSVKKTHIKNIVNKRENGKIGGRGTGLAVLDAEHVVLTEFGDSCVMIIKASTLDILTKVKLEKEPLDVTLLDSSTEFAVSTGWDVSFMAVKQNMTKIVHLRSLKVSEFCRGIHFHNNSILLCQPFTKPPEIRKLSLDGTVLMRVSVKENGSPLFKNPTYLTVHNDFIYVSDKTKLIKLTEQGTLVGTFEDKNLQRPGGLCSIEKGQLIVCCMSTNNIFVIKEDCTKVGMLFEKETETTGLCGLLSIAYCSDKKEIFLGCTSKDIIGYKIALTK